MSDWIEQFLTYTARVPSPELFRKWAAISAVGAAMERKCYVVTSERKAYPNLYILLVAPPGIGKTLAIDEAVMLVREVKDLKLAPDSVTKASMVDALAKCSRKIIVSGGAGLLDFHSMYLTADELGVLVPSHDLEFLSVLNALFDNRIAYREERRTGNRVVDIAQPQLNILAGTQPGFLANLLPEEAWTMGTTARFLMIYRNEGVKTQMGAKVVGKESSDPIADAPRNPNGLLKDLRKIVGLVGEFRFTEAAAQALEQWHDHGIEPIPQHSKLQHYKPRRIFFLLKLAMISTASRTCQLVIDLEDMERAKGWLLEAEALMPDIFRDMLGKSDKEVIDELHFFMWNRYQSNGRKALPAAMAINYLRARVPSEKVMRVMDIAERSNVIARLAGTDGASALYMPRPKHEHGME